MRRSCHAVFTARTGPLADFHPKARTDGLTIIEAIGQELLVYDPSSDKAHGLDPTAVLASWTGLAADRDVVLDTLAELDQGGLLRERLGTVRSRTRLMGRVTTMAALPP